jgi:hypothetical protein
VSVFQLQVNRTCYYDPANPVDVWMDGDLTSYLKYKRECVLCPVFVALRLDLVQCRAAVAPMALFVPRVRLCMLVSWL